MTKLFSLKNIISLFVIFIAFFAVGVFSVFASDGTLDTTFNVGTGFNDYVIALEQQPDGKVIAGGMFTSYNGTAINRIARINSDGSLDTTFNVGTGFNNQVRGLAIQTDGKILVVGQFTSYNGTAINRIARINSDGSLDTTFNVGTGFNNITRNVVVQPDGKIVVGGYFTAYNGVSRVRLARLNPDGSLDTTFTIGSGFNNYVNGVTLQTDGKILVGGTFTAYNGVSRVRLARLNPDGSLDTTFTIGSGFNNILYNITVQTDGKILVVGQFTTFQGVSANRIIRLNPDGSRDTTFSIGAGFNSHVFMSNVQSDGKIIVTGWFTAYI
ncbi:delta-60 repeat domain-containing protein [Candidatus Nomurabacteria bacterium]|nr:delta-60 repeat domain-containing protein [Candidatus Nomurabacteria bacterium]